MSRGTAKADKRKYVMNLPHDDHITNIHIQEIIAQVDSYVLSQNTTGKPDRTRAYIFIYFLCLGLNYQSVLIFGPYPVVLPIRFD